MYCEKCGQFVQDGASFCQNCGNSVKHSYNEFNYSNDNNTYKNDKPNFWFALIGFIIPIIGLILFIVYEGKQPKKAKSAGKGALISVVIKVIISVVLLIMYCVGVGYFVNNITDDYGDIYESVAGLFEEENTETIQDKYVDVSFGDFKISKDEYGFINSSLDVTVKNKAAEKSTFMIEIEAVDKEGARIGTDTVCADTLNPNQKTTLQAFEYIEKDKYDEYKNATFKVLNINKYDF